MALDPSSMTVRIIRHPWLTVLACVTLLLAGSLWRAATASTSIRPLSVAARQVTESRARPRSIQRSGISLAPEEPWHLRVIAPGETAVQTVVETPARTNRVPRPAALR